MKISICNVPLRSDELKTNYPPLGALAIIQSLRSAGHDADFYDINFFRPTDRELKDYFLANKFEVVGISATVSTSYRFVKKVVSLIREILPDAFIVIGGALTSASEVILRFNDVDCCVVGEGEKVIVNLMEYFASRSRGRLNEGGLRQIRGLCFLNKNGDAIFTGYEKQIPVDEIQDPDYGIIEKHSRIQQYITEPFYYEQFAYDKRAFQNHRKDKKLAIVVTSRGCINRCTFCYRWQQGIRVLPVERVIRNIKYLKENYNVGFISLGDENFGVMRRWVDEFIEKVKPLDILYRIAGICCENVDLSLLKRLKESGCSAIHYGFESGSDRMLKVIGKRSDASLNKNVARWTHDAGIQTVPALVVGMPGESYGTIKETTEFVKRVTEFWERDPIISINVLVVLPGTPVYEYARGKGFLGKTLKDEEMYLLRISDQSGSSLKHINVTDYPYFIVLSWVRSICWAARYHYYRIRNFRRLPAWKVLFAFLRSFLGRKKMEPEVLRSIYSNSLFCRLRYLISLLAVMYKNYKDDKRMFLERCFELLAWPFKMIFARKERFNRYISLRTFIEEKDTSLKSNDEYALASIRMGR